MAYEVTATRRRPQTFDDLIGQEFVAATLKNAISSGKIAHAYLFSGPRGCGKTSSARILAKALNCEKGPTADFCGVCSACTEITRGSSMDVIEIDGASNTSVNDIRQIKDEILFPPNSCRYKVYIIDEVHMLSTSAFNALLKTIEEPPPYVVFIFATTELHKVPATIKSRCQQFHFRLGSVEQIKELLVKAATEINIQADDEALYWIARESTGSFRDAYTLFDQIASFSDGHITYDKIRDTLGLVGVDSMNSLCEICITGDTGKAIEKIDEILQNGVSIEQLISNCADYLRSLLLVKSGITQEALLGQAVSRFSQTVLSSWNQIQLERGISIFLQLFRDVRYSLNPRYELELAVSRLCWLSSYISAQDVKIAIDNAKSLLLGAGASANTTASTNVGTNTSASVGANTVVQSSIPQNNIGIPLSSGNANTSPDDILLAAKFPPSSQGAGHPFQSSGSLSKQQNNTQINIDNSVEQRAAYQTSSDTPSTPTANHQTPSNVQTAPVNQLNRQQINSVDELREATIKELSYTHEIMSSALAQTGQWQEQSDVIIAPCDSVFLFNQLQRDEGLVSKLISDLAAKPLHFKPEFHKPEEVQQDISIPPQANVLCQMFRGTVIGHTPITQVMMNSNSQAMIPPDETHDFGVSDDYINYTEDTDEF